MTATQTHKLQLNAEVGKAQGYLRREDIVRAAKRALRWVNRPRNQGHKPPRHIADKMLLIKVTADA